MAQMTLQSHRSLLHYLFFTTGIKPQLTETISSVTHCSTTYHQALKATISEDKEKALQYAGIAHNLTCYKVYCDGSGFQDGAGATAILYRDNKAVQTLLLHIGPTTKHTIYETELIGIILAFSLLTLLACQLTTSSVVIGPDNQATIKSLNNQRAKPAHFLLDQIHTAAEHLHSEQDCLHCKPVFQCANHTNQHLPVQTRGVCDIQIHWVLSHSKMKKQTKPPNGLHLVSPVWPRISQPSSANPYH